MAFPVEAALARSCQPVYRDSFSTPVTSQTRTVYAGGGNRYVTNTAPDGSYVLSAYLNGRLTSVTRKTSSGTQLSQTTYGYDAHGRQSTVTDARNGTTTFTFNAADQAVTSTTPAPGTGQRAQITTTAYNTSLQAWKITQPDGTSLTNEFFLTGLLKKTSGSRAYPVEYTYDPQGRPSPEPHGFAVLGFPAEKILSSCLTRGRDFSKSRFATQGLCMTQ
ncbi:MAG: hypothetical protein HYY24_17090 [Verrucomicrobia bacterium]|nr:hypothetical protein [Verrucomicrobiota bacterium]